MNTIVIKTPNNWNVIKILFLISTLILVGLSVFLSIFTVIGDPAESLDYTTVSLYSSNESRVIVRNVKPAHGISIYKQLSLVEKIPWYRTYPIAPIIPDAGVRGGNFSMKFYNHEAIILYVESEKGTKRYKKKIPMEHEFWRGIGEVLQAIEKDKQ